ncbi:MAG: tetratricopeptide repeat protein [Deltaproteobacteria bacterium]|nr:tetratricopeptide repeat protein [Deltaproteobacteria bacterium]MBN2673929.1 tetratricopeptide repeat protein [Deltaproteobacteria bacterium]
MKFAGGKGVLELTDEPIEHDVKIELLELVIDNISFPFDVSQGIKGLANRRLKLQKLKLDIPLDAVLGAATGRVARNEWIHDFEAAFYDTHIGIALKYGPLNTAVPLSFRWVPIAWKNAVAFVIDDIRCYGALPGPLLSVAALCSAELGGFSIEGAYVVLDNPVKQLLLHVLPKRGWRLPAYDDLCIDEFTLHPRRLGMTFAMRSQHVGHKDALEQLLSMPMLKRLEELRSIRDADFFVGKGELDEARAQLAALLERSPENPAMITRLAMIDIMNRSLRKTETRLLEERIAGWQQRSDVLAVLAHSAALEEDSERELQMHRLLFESASPLEKMLGAMRISQLVGETDADTAVTYLEQAVSVRRDNPDALLELMDMYSRQNDVPKVQSMIPRWIAVHKEPDSQVQANIEAGRVLLGVSLWVEAATYFERALVANPDNEDAAWGLAEALAGKGDVQRAVSGYEQLAAASRRRGDRTAESEALGAIGEAWISQGEPELAIPRLQEALNVHHNSDVQLLLASAQVALGRVEQAVLNYEAALETALVHDKNWGNSALTLARLFFSHLEDFDAANHWIDQAAKCEELQRAAYELKIQVLEKQRKWADVALVLEKSMVKDGRNVSVDTVAKLASARVAAGEIVSAISTLESALAYHADNAVLLDVYIDALRKKGNVRKLEDALQRRFGSVGPGKRREQMATELGDLHLYDFEDPATAERWYRLAVQENELSLGAREGLVEALRRTGSGNIEEEIDKLLPLYQQNDNKEKVAETLFVLAEHQIHTGNGKQAAVLLRKALPDLAERKRNDALLKIADVLLKEQEFALAKDLYATVRKSKGERDSYLAALGEARAAIATEDYSAAFSAAVDAGSGPAELRVEAVRILAEASVYIGKVSEALSILRRVAQNVEDEDALDLLDLGAEIAWKELNDLPLARTLFEEILKIYPESERAKNRLLSLLEASGNRAELARGLVRFFSGTKSGIADVKRAADFFFAEGLFEEAAEALQRAYESFPDLEIGKMLATALSRSGQEQQMLDVLSRIARKDEHARQMLLEHYEAKGDSDAMLALLSGAKSTNADSELARLERLAALTMEKGETLVAAGYLLEAVEIAKDETVLRELLTEVMSIAKLSHHPQLFARAVESMVPIASNREAAELRLDLAVMYHRAKLFEECALLVEENDSLRAASMDRLLRAVEDNPDMMPLISAVSGYAYEQGRWEDVERLLSMQIKRVRDGKKNGLLKRRAGVREIRLGDREGAAEDWMALFRAGELDEMELEQLSELLETLERREDLLHVLIKRAKVMDYELSMVMKVANLAAQLEQRPLEKQFLRMAFERKPSFDVALHLFSVLSFPKDKEEMKKMLPTVLSDLASLPVAVQKNVYEVQLEVVGRENMRAWSDTMMALIALCPTEPQYLTELINALEGAEEWSLLAQQLEQCTEFALPESSEIEVWVGLGNVYRNQLGDDERAGICYQKALDLSGDNMQALMFLAERAFKARDWGGLRTHLKSASGSAWHPDIAYWKAMMFESEGKSLEAFALFDELVDRAPQFQGAYEGYLRTAPDEGHEDGVRAALGVINRKGGVAQMPAGMHRKAARAYFMVDDIDKAQRHLELALSLEPLDKASLLLLEKVYARTGQMSARAYTLEKLAHMADGDEKIDFFVASARVFLDELKDSAKAQSLFAKAAEVSNSEPDVLLGLADCAWTNREWAKVTSNQERLRLVAPHLNIDPVRKYQFAYALAQTAEWPVEDVLELVERTIPNLVGSVYDDALQLQQRLNDEMKTRKKR